MGLLTCGLSNYPRDHNFWLTRGSGCESVYVGLTQNLHDLTSQNVTFLQEISRNCSGLGLQHASITKMRTPAHETQVLLASDSSMTQVLLNPWRLVLDLARMFLKILGHLLNMYQNVKIRTHGCTGTKGLTSLVMREVNCPVCIVSKKAMSMRMTLAKSFMRTDIAMRRWTSSWAKDFKPPRRCGNRRVSRLAVFKFSKIWTFSFGANWQQQFDVKQKSWRSLGSWPLGAPALAERLNAPCNANTMR